MNRHIPMVSVSVCFPKRRYMQHLGFDPQNNDEVVSVHFALDMYFCDFLPDTSSHFVLLPGDHLFLPWYGKAYFHLSYLHPFVTLIAAGGLHIGNQIWKHVFILLSRRKLWDPSYSLLHILGEIWRYCTTCNRTKASKHKHSWFHYFLDQHAGW